MTMLIFPTPTTAMNMKKKDERPQKGEFKPGFFLKSLKNIIFS